MGATLEKLRKYIRAEVGDPAPLRKISTSALIHDGGNDAAFFKDDTFNFSALGIIVGDVIWNGSDGGSISTIQSITTTTNPNDTLIVGPIEGGTNNNFTDGDTPYIYDREAQRGLDGTRWTDDEVEDALSQAQKIVAIRFGGVEKYSIKEDIKVMSKVDLTVQSNTYVIGETLTDGTKGHTAVVEYVGDTFVVISTFRSKVPVTAVAGTLETGELVTGSSSAETGVLITDGTTYLMLENHPDVFTSGETLTGGTSGATVTVDNATYAPGLFAAGVTLTGGTSSATANVKATYAANNICLGQDMPTNLKHLLVARWWDGSNWMPLVRDNIREFTTLAGVSGDPARMSVFGVDQLVSNAAPNMKIWLWPSNSTKQYNELHLFYMAWDRSLSSDTDTTDFDNKTERLIVLEGAKTLAGQDNDEELWKRIVGDIVITNTDIQAADGNETDRVAEVMHWDHGFSDDDGVFIP